MLTVQLILPDLQKILVMVTAWSEIRHALDLRFGIVHGASLIDQHLKRQMGTVKTTTHEKLLV